MEHYEQKFVLKGYDSLTSFRSYSLAKPLKRALNWNQNKHESLSRFQARPVKAATNDFFKSQDEYPSATAKTYTERSFHH